MQTSGCLGSTNRADLNHTANYRQTDAAHHLASPIAGPTDMQGHRRSCQIQDDQETTRALYRSNTALGGCWLDTVGHLKPCDDKHAPVRLYRTYGEWWEAGQKAPEAPKKDQLLQSRYWPFGQDVTKLYQTEHRQHKYQLDQREVSKAKPYIPPRNGSLPDLRMHRDARQHDLDMSYHSSFHKSDPRFSMLGLSQSQVPGRQSPAVPGSSRGQDRSAPPTGRSAGASSRGGRNK